MTGEIGMARAAIVAVQENRFCGFCHGGDRLCEAGFRHGQTPSMRLQDGDLQVNCEKLRSLECRLGFRFPDVSRKCRLRYRIESSDLHCHLVMQRPIRNVNDLFNF